MNSDKSSLGESSRSETSHRDSSESITGVGDGDSVNISQDQFGQLMQAISSSRMDFASQLSSFKQEIRQSQDEVASKALKKVKLDKPFTYRRKGNEEQATFNSKVESAVAEAQAELDSIPTSPVVVRAQEALKRGTKLIEERQKLIKLADRSEFGWSVVDEYTADELAVDSDDEKRIEKAEKLAEKKALRKKKKRAELAKPPVRHHQPYSPMRIGPIPQVIPGPPRRGTVINSSSPRPLGPCFSCGEMGHLRTYCPKTPVVAEGKPKWYPPVESVSARVVDEECVTCTCMNENTDCTCSTVNECGGVLVDDVADAPVAVDDVVDMPVTCPFEWEENVHETGVQSVVSVKGRLKERINFWRKELEAPEFVLSVIENGYVLPLKSLPVKFAQCNHSSALNNVSFVDQSVSELFKSGAIREVATLPHICSPLSVVENSKGKKRLVINLRHLNKYLWKEKFKYEDLRIAMLLMEKGDFLFSFDLKSGYHHIDIAEAHQKFLGFEWGGHYYVFTVLPFGLSTACYIFTKMLRPFVRFCRARGLKMIVYLDDGLGAVSGFLEASKASKLVFD